MEIFCKIGNQWESLISIVELEVLVYLAFNKITMKWWILNMFVYM
jgi:hypothetical protein